MPLRKSLQAKHKNLLNSIPDTMTIMSRIPCEGFYTLESFTISMDELQRSIERE